MKNPSISNHPNDMDESRLGPLLYFAYGSNMSAAQMTDRCPGSRAIGAASVEGWELRFDRPSIRWGGHVADIVTSPGKVAWGVVWELTEQHLDALDRFEGVAIGAYRREHVTVELHAGPASRLLWCVSYVVCAPGEPGSPAPGYLEVMLQGAKEHQLPAWYIEQLNGFGSP